MRVVQLSQISRKYIYIIGFIKRKPLTSFKYIAGVPTVQIQWNKRQNVIEREVNAPQAAVWQEVPLEVNRFSEVKQREREEGMGSRRGTREDTVLENFFSKSAPKTFPA